MQHVPEFPGQRCAPKIEFALRSLPSSVYLAGPDDVEPTKEQESTREEPEEEQEATREEGLPTIMHKSAHVATNHPQTILDH